jgi:glycerol-3-phosphate O-acyltransferase
MLRLRRLVEQTDGLYRADPANAVLLRYYANSIAHLLAGEAARARAAAAAS